MSGAGSLFRNAPQVTLLRASAQRRRFLVFVRAGGGGNSPVAPALLAAPRDFDLAVSYYAEPAAADPMLPQAEILLGGGLSKFHAAKGLFQAWPAAAGYEAVLFADEDVTLRFNPAAFFGFFLQEGLALAQPSLSQDSFSNFRLLLHNPSFIYRTTNFVEVMAPCFARGFLAEAWPRFDRSISTWGLDVLWAAMLGPGREAAVLDCFQMQHAKPMDPNGAFYRYLAGMGVDCYAELRSIMDELGIPQHKLTQGRLVCLVETLLRPPPDPRPGQGQAGAG